MAAESYFGGGTPSLIVNANARFEIIVAIPGGDIATEQDRWAEINPGWKISIARWRGGRPGALSFDL